MPSPELRAWAEAPALPQHVWSWGSETEAAGLRRDGAVLVRPDGQIGCLSDGAGATATLEAYVTRWGLSFGNTSDDPSSHLRHGL
jgi:hypothetical protein